MEVGVCVAQNMRQYQEDRWVALGTQTRKSRRNWREWWYSTTPAEDSSPPFATENTAVFAVFDGHGGAACSHFLTTQFRTTLEQEVRRLRAHDVHAQSPTTTVLENTLLALDHFFVRQQRRATGVPPTARNSRNRGGSTAVVVAVDPNKHEITCSNVGDSRAILIRKKSEGPTTSILPLSHDHSPNSRPDEVTRITKLGGEVKVSAQESAFALVYGKKAGPRIYQHDGSGGLNMTRALGDDYLKPLIIPQPETIQIPMHEEDLLLVLASDGMWDVLTNEEVNQLIRQLYESSSNTFDASTFVQRCALMLVQEAQRQGSQDNITCMVIQLPAHQ